MKRNQNANLTGKLRNELRSSVSGEKRGKPECSTASPRERALHRKVASGDHAVTQPLEFVWRIEVEKLMDSFETLGDL